jgi:photosystem II stability/assembly factor-like uncharacterized protein
LRKRLFLICIFVLFLVPFHRGLPQGWAWQNPLPHGRMINDVVLADQDWAYAPCADGWFHRSGDGGRNWVSARIATRDLMKVLSPSKGVVVVIADNATVLRSTDFGVTWTLQYRASSTQSGGYDLKSHPSAGFLALFGQNTLVRSTDDGVTWSSIAIKPGNGETLYTIAMQAERTWYAASARRVYKTTDGGVNWGVDTTIKADGLTALSFVDSLYGYQIRNGQLLQTHDGGATWREMNIFGFDNNLAIAARPGLGNTIFCLSSGKYLVNKSTDGGATWNISLTSTVFHDGYVSAMSFCDDRHGLIVGEGGRIVRTEDGGSSWSIIRGLGYIGPLSDMVFTTPRNGIALSYAPTILLTTNGGARWDESVPHPEYSPRRISMYSPSSGYVFAYDAATRTHVLATTNDGRSWSYRGALPIQINDARYVQPQQILAVSRDTVFVSVSDGVLYRSTDGAQSWDSLYTCTLFNNDWESGISLHWFPPRTLIYVGSQGVGRSTDAGGTWACFGTNGLRNVQFFHPDTAVGIAMGRSSLTTNGGAQWTILSQNGFQLQHFFNPVEGFGLATQTMNNEVTGVLYRTFDGGSTWTQSSLHETIDNWYGWTFLSKEEGWAYGSGGMIRHTTNGGLTWGSHPPLAPETRILGPVHPQPFSIGRHRAASMSIVVPGPASRQVSLGVYSILGERIATLLEGCFASGEHAVALDAHTVPGGLHPGVYLLRLTVGVRSETGVLMVTE